MRCEEVQDLASAWLDNELSEPRAGAVAEHEANCEACHAYISDLRLLAEQMARLGREPAPPGLAERIRVTLAEERGPEHRDGTVIPLASSQRWRGFVQQFASMAAVCLISVFGTWAVMHQPNSVPETEHDVVAAHVRSLLQNSTIQVVSSDSHTVRPWFNGKVEFAPPVKDLAAEGFPLYGGRLDFVDGHRVATLVYHHGPHTISVFVWPEDSASPARPLLTQLDGLNVLSWTKDGMVWWAVSDMEQSEMKELRALL
ncbi:MAG: anti-sigma factor [Acetobacteraceae bacterium]|jgi:anti-sigma factor RsiW